MRPTLVLVACLAAASHAHGQLFNFTLAPNDGSMTAPIAVSGSSLLDLTEDMLDTTGQFQSFDGVGFDASLDYADVDDAISFSVNSAGDMATLQFSLLGGGSRVFTFSGPDIEDQIETFLKESAAAEVEAFLKELALQSVVAITDGNPSAITARSSNYRYNRFGLYEDLRPRHVPVMRTGEVVDAEDGQPSEVRVNDQVDSGGAVFGYDFSYGILETDPGEGTELNSSLTMETRVGDRVAIVLGTNFTYHEIEDSDVYNLGLHFDVPITLLKREKMNGLTIKVIPGVFIRGGGSLDFVAGGLLYGFGGTGVVGYNIGGLALSGIVQLDIHESIKVQYDDYEFDSGVSQQILKVGGRAEYSFDDEIYVYGGLAYTDFLEDAAIDNYLSPAGGIGLRTEHGFNINVGYEGDLADGYESHRGHVGLRFSF